jgi:hypothetical protein
MYDGDHRRAAANVARNTLRSTQGISMATYEFTVNVKTQYLPE